jgi:hypothetical protein
MRPQPTSIRIWWDTSVSAYRVTSPYNKQLDDALKSQIPASDRHFDEVTKTWTIVERQFAPLQTLLKMIGLQAVVITRQRAEQAAAAQSAGTSGNAQATQRGRPLDAVIIEFVRLLPYDAAKAAYRRAALDLHPDRNNGDSSKMASLNADWDRIAKEVYGQQ